VLRTAEVTDPSVGDASGYAPTYYPGTPDLSDAQRVTLGVAQENTSVSFGLIATRLVRVAGQVMTSLGAPAAGGLVTLAPPGGLRPGVMMQGGAGSRIDQNGSFRITSVAPGRYQLQARAGMQPGGGGEFAKQDIIVGVEDVSGLTMITAPGARVAGTIVSDTGEPFSFKPQQVQVAARAANPEAPALGPGGAAAARVANDYSFELANVSDARLIRVGGVQGWTLKAVHLNGQEITDIPVEFPPGQFVTGVQVTLTQKIGELSGLVTNSRGEPVLDASVVIFPSDEKLWTYQSRFVRTARPDQEGRFRINAMPPSQNYLAIAVQGLEDGQAGDPEFLATVKEAATSFSLGEGESKSVDLKVATGR
jgi:hypothetical protein